MLRHMTSGKDTRSLCLYVLCKLLLVRNIFWYFLKKHFMVTKVAFIWLINKARVLK